MHVYIEESHWWEQVARYVKTWGLYVRAVDDNARMATEYRNTDEFRGATFRDCDMTGVRIVSSIVDDLWIAGFDGTAGRVVVDDVDVTTYVAAELDRRFPERVRLRAAESLDDFRSLWATLSDLWAGTIERAGALTEARLQQRIDGEWSFVETLRHLVFGIDTWVGRMLHGESMPWHPLGLPPTDSAGAGAAHMGLDLVAQPSFAEVAEVYATRRARVDEEFASVTDLTDVRTAAPVPGAEPESLTVGDCLTVLLHEHYAHRRFAERDLAAP
jgi:hypothetical protein